MNAIEYKIGQKWIVKHPIVIGDRIVANKGDLLVVNLLHPDHQEVAFELVEKSNFIILVKMRDITDLLKLLIEKPIAEMLVDIATDMASAAENLDYESAHSDADTLLLQALQEVGKAYPDLAPAIQQIFDSYGKVGKWYA